MTRRRCVARNTYIFGCVDGEPLFYLSTAFWRLFAPICVQSDRKRGDEQKLSASSWLILSTKLANVRDARAPWKTRNSSSRLSTSSTSCFCANAPSHRAKQFMVGEGEWLRVLPVATILGVILFRPIASAEIASISVTFQGVATLRDYKSVRWSSARDAKEDAVNILRRRQSSPANSGRTASI